MGKGWAKVGRRLCEGWVKIRQRLGEGWAKVGRRLGEAGQRSVKLSGLYNNLAIFQFHDMPSQNSSAVSVSSLLAGAPLSSND